MQAFSRPIVAAFPLPALAVALICALYLLVGSFGHDPWKTDDALHLGVAHAFSTGGSWLIPRVAGEAWLGVTPAYHWVAASLAWLTQWALPFHDGARLASPLFGALFLFLLHRAATTLHGRDAGLLAPLLTIGTLGLVVPIHDAQPAIAVLAASAAAYWGLALLPGLGGAVLLGLGCGGAFLAGGLGGAVPLLPLLLFPLAQKRWPAFFIALYTAIAVASLWPTLLSLRSPGHLIAWWNTELAAVAIHRSPREADYLELLAWFAWPVLPLGAWALWADRFRWREPGLALPLAGTLIALAWLLTHEARPLVALPLLPPLVLLATSGTHKLRRGAANAFDWFAMMTFTLLISLVWLGGIAMWTGLPEQIARNFAKLEPGFQAHVSVVATGVALMFTAGWMVALVKLPRSPWRAGIRWAAGIAALWGVLVALWFPWIDYGKTYRGVARSLRQVLPHNTECVAGRNIGLAQRALLDYFADLRTVSGPRGGTCEWLLVQGAARSEKVPDGWRRVWDGHRPGDKTERLRLYRKEP